MPKARPTVIDLFCGAGGLSEGFRQAGFKVLIGNDVDQASGRTFAATHPEAHFIGTPIQDLSVGRLLNIAGLAKGELDVLVGGPPCQGYSVYNHKRGMGDPRARLFEEYMRIVAGLRPKWIVMENVTGITSIENGELVQEILTRFSELGYQVDYRVLKAEQYGIPQERRRVFFIGNRLGLSNPFPVPTHGPGLLPYVTVAQAISDLPVLANGGGIEVAKYRSAAKSAFQRALRGNRTTVANHFAPRLSPINMQRMAHIPQGGSWRDIPVHLLPEGMKRAKRSDHTKRYGRLSEGGLACTILTKCDLHWGAYIHPTQDRAISVREAARLQSFPDSFEFFGSRTEQYVQIGNAVPPLLGKAVAEAVLTASTGIGQPKRRRIAQHELLLTA